MRSKITNKSLAHKTNGLNDFFFYKKKTDKYIFFDRDGTLIKDTGYVHKKEQLKFLPGVISGLKKLQEAGYKFIIITNQAGIARGFFSLKEAKKFNGIMISVLARHKIKIEKMYLCPHHPEFTGNCLCRKPQPKLAKIAAQKFKIKLADSIFIGDKDSDIEMGRRCKGVTILVKNNQYSSKIRADFKVNNFKEILKILNIDPS